MVDNVKGKQLSNSNTLLGFVSRKAEANVVTKLPEMKQVGQVETDRSQLKDKGAANRSSFELPSLSQIDPSVLDQLPDQLKNDIFDEYQRKGVAVDGIRPIVELKKDLVENEPKAGPSKTTVPSGVSKRVAIEDKSPKKDALSYEGISEISDIDSSYWLALPDEIKAEIEKDIRNRKSEPASLILESTRTEPSRWTSTSAVIDKSAKDGPVSYDGINEVSDIDSSYWSALPDEIKAEIEQDINQRKSEPVSPAKSWNAIFRARRSPVKTVAKSAINVRNKKIKPPLSSKQSPQKRSPSATHKIETVFKSGPVWEKVNPCSMQTSSVHTRYIVCIWKT